MTAAQRFCSMLALKPRMVSEVAANAGHEQRADQDGLRPEDKPFGRHCTYQAPADSVFIVGPQDVPDARQPHEIGGLGQVLPKEAQEQSDKADHQHQANPGMQPAHRGATPNSSLSQKGWDGTAKARSATGARN